MFVGGVALPITVETLLCVRSANRHHMHPMNTTYSLSFPLENAILKAKVNVHLLVSFGVSKFYSPFSRLVGYVF